MATENTATIRCSGTLYSGRTLVVHREASRDYYEDASAVCNSCKQRVKLQHGRRMPSHWLEVTIHRAFTE